MLLHKWPLFNVSIEKMTASSGHTRKTVFCYGLYKDHLSKVSAFQAFFQAVEEMIFVFFFSFQQDGFYGSLANEAAGV